MKTQLNELKRMQQLAGLLNENFEDNLNKKNINDILNIDDEDISLIDNTGEEFNGSIDGNTATFWITGIEDPYYDETREENWDFPEVFKPILDAGGEYTVSSGDEGYEIDIKIDLDTLKKLYPVENNL
jgi:hypothetical protein